MTAPTAGTPDVGHPSLTELAELDENLLADERSAAVAAHVAGCAECNRHQAEVRAVGPALSAAPAPAMPADVSARLGQVLVAEGARREHRRVARAVPGVGRPGSAAGGLERKTLGRFGADLPRRSLRRAVLPALAAAMTAGAVGFGAYVASATAGLNEPPVVAAVSSNRLAAQAGALEAREDLEPHRFSRAWQCAREATDGRIVALASSTVDGVPALLVYTRAGADTLVTVVTGCGTGRPRPGTTALVSRR